MAYMGAIEVLPVVDLMAVQSLKAKRSSIHYNYRLQMDKRFQLGQFSKDVCHFDFYSQRLNDLPITPLSS